MRQPKNLAPNRILHHIIESEHDPLGSSKNYTYIIVGTSGPTGKTWLCSGLKTYGFNAIELSEDLNPMVHYSSSRNHFIINPLAKTVLIVLNERINPKVALY